MTVRCIYFASITGHSRFTRNYCTHRPAAMLPRNLKENDPAVAWHGLQRMPNDPNSGGRRLLARVSVTGLEVPVRRTPWSWFRGTSFRSLLQGGLKGLGPGARRGRRSEGRRGLHLRKASRRLQRGLKGA